MYSFNPCKINLGRFASAIVAPHRGVRNLHSTMPVTSGDYYEHLFTVKDVFPVKMAALRRLIGLVPGMVQCARQGGRTISEYI